ncbi:Protein FAM110C [Plecturocebus cupreus]
MRALAALDAPPSERLLPREPDAARPARRSAVERLAADRAKYVRGPGAGRGAASEGSGPGVVPCPGNDPAPPARAPAPAPAPVARRTIARKPLRPDSLVIYRQKCEFVRGPGADGRRASLGKKLFPGPGRDRAPETPRTGDEAEAGNAESAPAPPGPAAADTPAPSAPSAVPAAPPDPEPRVRRRRGLQRSQSDLSSRRSAPAEADTFFQYCGLDPEVVEALGPENFSAGSDRGALRVRSVSVATSGSGFSRHSRGDDGLQEEELAEQLPSGPSVVERNARIIKWLYTCRKAAETPGRALQGLRAPAGAGPGACPEGGAGCVRGVGPRRARAGCSRCLEWRAVWSERDPGDRRGAM